MIGTCGALDPGLATGDVVIPSRAVAQEGVAHLYKGLAEDTGIVSSDLELTAKGRSALEQRNQNCRFPPSDLEFHLRSKRGDGRGVARNRLRISGHEAATLFTVAKHFGFAATALLVVWDQLTADRSFLDPLTPRNKPVWTPPCSKQPWDKP